MRVSRLLGAGVVASTLLAGLSGTAHAQVIDGVGLFVSEARSSFFQAHPSYSPQAMMIVVATGDGATTRSFGWNCDDSQLFGIGSNTKPFTAMLAAIADEHGTMTLDSTLADWVGWDTCHTHTVCVDPNICIPEPICPRATSTTITLRDLADMYSGLPKNPPHTDETSKSALYNRVFENCDGLGEGDVTEQACQNDGVYNYSNFGYAVLGNILADHYYGHIGDTSGPSYWHDLVATRITTPLGMSHTVTGTSGGAPPSGAITGYNCNGNNGLAGEPFSCSPATQGAWFFSDPTGWAAAGLWSTAGDMGTWMNTNLGNFSVVSADGDIETAVLDYMQRSQHGQAWDGLAWEFDQTTITAPSGSKLDLMWKDGDAPGFHSYVALLPRGINAGNASRGVAVMVNFDTNTDQSTITNEVDGIASTILQSLVTYGL